VILGVDGTALQGARSGSGWFLSHLLESLSRVLEEDKVLVWMNNAPEEEQLRVPQNRYMTLTSTHFPAAALKLSWGTLGTPTLEGLVGRSLDACLYATPVFPPQKRGGKAIYVHDIAQWVAAEPNQGPTTIPGPKEFERVLSAADIILTGTEFNRDAILKRLPSYSADKVRVIPQGVAPLFQKPATREKIEEVRKLYGIQKPFFLYAGTVETRKNLLRLVHGFLLFQQQSGQDVQLLLAGPKGWIGEDFIQFLLSPVLAGRVRCLGAVSPEHLHALYSDAFLFAYPALQEGSGATMLEAMGCGAPVVCSDAGALPETAGNAALLVPPTQVGQWAAAFQKVVGDPEVRQELRNRGFVRAAQCKGEMSARAVLSALVSTAVKT
jgi:glycosyltransferase involved in cell wall biosynthesis